MASLVIAGGTLFDAIRGTVTRGGAVRIEDDRITAVGPASAGSRAQADVVVVRGDPLADIRVLQDVARITCVIKAGVVVTRR